MNSPLSSGNVRILTLTDLGKLQAKQAKKRGLAIMTLEKDALLQRVKDGGWSGKFLAQAFLSAYHIIPFNRSLGKLIRLDAEGFRLFHQILHIRYVKGWCDDDYALLAAVIEDILGRESRDDSEVE